MKLDKPLYLHNLRGYPAPEEVLSDPSRGWIRIGEFPARPLRPDITSSAQGLLLELLSEITPIEVPGAVYIGSARGEMGALFTAYEAWKNERQGLRAIPETSAGALSALVAEKLGSSGPAITLSQTCISGLAALYQAILYTMATGEPTCFGAVEAPLHPLLVESFGFLRLASRRKSFPPTIPFSDNSVALAEGVALGFVRLDPSPWRVESICLHTHKGRESPFTAISVTAFSALLASLTDAPPEAVILHAPGTRKGDFAEIAAIESVWGRLPAITIKPLIGHSIGASGLLSLLWAQWLLLHRRWLYDTDQVRVSPPDWPVIPSEEEVGMVRNIRLEKGLRRIAILGAGFGGGLGGVILRYEPF